MFKVVILKLQFKSSKKKLNRNKIPLFVANNLVEEKPFICFYKKVIICCRKKLLSSRKNTMWQMKFYGNADRHYLMEMGSNILCSRFFEENKDNNMMLFLMIFAECV